jgi:cardiolipin synthase
VRWASLSYYDELLEAGCLIFESPRMIHSKYLLIDDNVAAVGSANMDIRSFHLNYEITAMFYDRGVNAALAEWFERDARQAHNVTCEERAKLGAVERGLEALARVTSPML